MAVAADRIREGGIGARFRPRAQAWYRDVSEAPAPAGPAPLEFLASPVFSRPHRRYNPLLDEWVLVSPERTRRPWQGREEAPAAETVPAYDPACYLCPGNRRAGGDVNPHYSGTFVFTNDFAALRPDVSAARVEHGLFRAEAEPGTCRVICFSPRHDLRMAGMRESEVRHVVDAWALQSAELGEHYRWVQVFENRGETMGASNPHPHGQIWAGAALPVEGAREDASQRRWLGEHGSRLLLEYAAQERGGTRAVLEDDEWLVLVPFWAVWPYETLVVPKRPVERLPDLDDSARSSLARAMIGLIDRYDGLFGVPFPYSMGWHQAPFDSGDHGHWQLHAHFYPPLLRSATVRKYMVGYEMLAEPQRDLSPEDAAFRLRSAAGSDPRP
jgi:UDPglucose--hexose-1-phosphate uridylyltransferase